MARTKSTSGTKSSAIRAAIAANPKAKPKEIVADLAAKGIKVNVSLVYMLKSKGKAKKQKATRAAAVTSASASGSREPVELVRRTRQLAIDAGGFKNLIDLVRILGEHTIGNG